MIPAQRKFGQYVKDRPLSQKLQRVPGVWKPLKSRGLWGNDDERND